MYKDSIRRFGAFFLLLTMWVGAIAVSPVNIAAQEAVKKDDDKKDKKDEKTPTTSSLKPLSEKENPEMIGKRKINGGTDKLFGWLGGSQEAEMKIGRQLSLQVEQQAKLVDDPLITEYVNRVGQNIVLHSDAKVPFTIKVIDSDEVNAFALPGGFFYGSSVSSTLAQLMRALDEAPVASVALFTSTLPLASSTNPVMPSSVAAVRSICRPR
jgi:hypothetical protein